MNKLKKLINVCHWMNSVGYSPATSGNYSTRIDEENFYISASGINKGNIKEEDFIKMNLTGEVFNTNKKPSDEALIHGKIYELIPSAEFVLHSHSVSSTVLSMTTQGDYIDFVGYEMQKAFCGIKDHLIKISVPMVKNSQIISEINDEFESILNPKIPVFVIQGHGVYAWGKTIAETKKHLEAIEFLLKCKLEVLKLGSL